MYVLAQWVRVMADVGAVCLECEAGAPTSKVRWKLVWECNFFDN